MQEGQRPVVVVVMLGQQGACDTVVAVGRFRRTSGDDRRRSGGNDAPPVVTVGRRTSGDDRRRSGGNDAPPEVGRRKVKVRVKVKKGRRVAPDSDAQHEEFEFLDPAVVRSRRGMGQKRMSTRVADRFGKKAASAAKKKKAAKKAAKANQRKDARSIVAAGGGGASMQAQSSAGARLPALNPATAAVATTAAAAAALPGGFADEEDLDGLEGGELDGSSSGDGKSFWLDVATCQMDALDWCVVGTFVVNVVAVAIASYLLTLGGANNRQPAFIILGVLSFVWSILFFMERNGGWHVMLLARYFLVLVRYSTCSRLTPNLCPLSLLYLLAVNHQVHVAYSSSDVHSRQRTSCKEV